MVYLSKKSVVNSPKVVLTSITITGPWPLFYFLFLISK